MPLYVWRNREFSLVRMVHQFCFDVTVIRHGLDPLPL